MIGWCYVLVYVPPQFFYLKNYYHTAAAVPMHAWSQMENGQRPGDKCPDQKSMQNETCVG